MVNLEIGEQQWPLTRRSTLRPRSTAYRSTNHMLKHPYQHLTIMTNV